MKRRKFMTWVVLSVVIGGGLYMAWSLTSRDAYESASYTVVQNDGDFEVREYPELKLATTDMGFASQGNDGSFMRLFRYISGANATEQKVAMTTPVFMSEGTEEESGQMGFVVPADVVKSGTPEPTGPRVSIKERLGGRFAVLRFNGCMERTDRNEMEQRLREWIVSQSFEADDEVEFAGYDAPWMPGPFRRNEVLIRLK
ncbi:MAG: heme-binding protein [Planctomycetaceae bacterium]